MKVRLKVTLFISVLRECARSNNGSDNLTNFNHQSASKEANPWTSVSRLEALSITVVDLLSPDLIPLPRACYDNEFVKHPDTIER